MRTLLIALAAVLAMLHPLLALAAVLAACTGLAWLLARSLRGLPSPLDTSRWRTP